MKRYYIKLITGFACLFFLLFLVLNASAETITGDEQACNILATESMSAVMYRDLGFTWADTLPQLMTALEAAKGQPGSIAQDDSDVALIVDLFQTVWREADTPEGTALRIYSACMGDKS